MSTESKFSFTTKVDGDLLTVRADNIDEFETNINLAATTVTAINALQAAARGAAVPATQGIPAVQQVFPQAQVVATQLTAPPAAQPTPAAHVCVHGPMKFIPGGISKSTGKAYAEFWACPHPVREEQCKARK